MRRVLPYITAILAIVVVGYAQSLRVVDSRALNAAVARLNQVPLRVGSWQGRDETIDPRELQMGKIDGSLLRRYANQDGSEVTLLIVCGRPGPISVHTPDICYAGAGYELREALSHYTVPSTPPAQFWVGNFYNNSPVPKSPLRILWAWNGSNGWQAPSSPRMTFAPKPFLYKMYVVRDMNQSAPPLIETDPSVDFLRAIIPVLDATLTPETTRAPASA